MKHHSARYKHRMQLTKACQKTKGTKLRTRCTRLSVRVANKKTAATHFGYILPLSAKKNSKRDFSEVNKDITNQLSAFDSPSNGELKLKVYALCTNENILGKALKISSYKILTIFQK